MSATTAKLYTADQVAERLGGLRRGGNWIARCPAHDDRTPSLSITADAERGFKARCHAGCDQGEVFSAILATMSGEVPERVGSNGSGNGAMPGAEPLGRFAAEYTYRNEAGAAIFAVRRYTEPKGFRQFRYSTAEQRYLPGMAGVRRVIYRLPEVAAAVSLQREDRLTEPVYIVEGEKDADALAALGLVATCNPGGAGKWLAEYSGPLSGSEVCILPDNDEAGAEHAEKVASSLLAAGATVRVLDLPGLQPKGDVSDWIEAGGSKAELLALTGRVRPLTPKERPAKRAVGVIGNAERFVDRYGDRLRYVKEWGWLAYSGGAWSRERGGVVDCYAKETIRALHIEAADERDEAKRKELAAWASQCERNRGKILGDTLALAESDPRVRVTAEDFDSNPLLLNVENGTLDLGAINPESYAFTLRPHDPRDLLTQTAPARFDQDAACPRWLRFVSEIMGDDAETVDFLQRAVGLALTGEIREHALFILHGNGANGKTTFLTVLQEVLGDYAQAASPDLLVGTRDEADPRSGVAGLRGKRLVVTSEVGSGRRLNEALVKKITGSDRLRASYLYHDAFEFAPTHKIFLATNHKPRIEGTDRGVWRRVYLVPFNESFEGSKQNTSLKDELLAESAGILLWALIGLVKYRRVGLNPPARVVTATEAYRLAEDFLGAFLEERCTLGPKAEVTAKDFRTEYVKWCEERAEKPASAKAVGNRLAELGCESGQKSGGLRYWRGITLTGERDQ